MQLDHGAVIVPRGTSLSASGQVERLVMGTLTHFLAVCFKIRFFCQCFC